MAMWSLAILLSLPAFAFKLHLQENLSIPLPPGFTALAPPNQLVVTAFEATPFVGRNGVFLAEVGRSAGPVEEVPGSSGINWPNSITVLPSEVFGFRALALGDGFLVPSHTTGGVWIMEAKARPKRLKRPVKISQDKSGWFYHQVHFADMDGDGLLDAVTARCQYSVLPWAKKSGELVWLKNPGKDALSGAPWQEHALGQGPDFLFCVKPKGSFGLVAPEFISGKVVYWYMDGHKMRSRVLDDTTGPGFSCSWADLNNDGRLELLLTNHAQFNGSVFAYSFSSDDLATARAERHTLADGFSPVQVKKGSASPGDALAFQVQLNSTGKPQIFVSGDNSNSIYLLTPASESSHDWSYHKEKLADLESDVGRPSIGDVDHDGFADIFVPLYNAKKVVHYTVQRAGARSFQV